MIPVLGVPYLSRSDLFVEMITSINHPIGDIIVVDNSTDGTIPQVDDALYITPHRNMGVSWSWNTIIMARPHAPWWAIANSDIKLGPYDLQNLCEAMDSGGELVLIESMALFGISASCIQKVGWFDTNFIPAYCEDNDYIYRARLLGVEPRFITPGFTHFGSATIKSSPHAMMNNNRTYPLNVRYYSEKWGGIMGKERFTTPFDKGGSPRDCPTLDFERFRTLSWD